MRYPSSALGAQPHPTAHLKASGAAAGRIGKQKEPSSVPLAEAQNQTGARKRAPFARRTVTTLTTFRALRRTGTFFKTHSTGNHQTSPAHEHSTCSSKFVTPITYHQPQQRRHIEITGRSEIARFDLSRSTVLETSLYSLTPNKSRAQAACDTTNPKSLDRTGLIFYPHL